MAISYGLDRNYAASTNAGRTQVSTLGISQVGLVFNLDFGTTGSYIGTGPTVKDLKNSITGSIYGTVVPTTLNYGGLVFNGTSNVIYLGIAPLVSPLTVTTDLTIEQIFTPTAYQTSNYYGITNQLMAKGSASTYNYAVQPSSDTTYSFTKRTSPEGLQYHTFTVPSMLNRVNIVTITVTGGTVSCYYNGVWQGSTPLVGTPITGVDTDPLYIGGLGTHLYTNFIGTYYAGRVYNRALSATEILRNFNVVQLRYGI